MRRSTHFAAAVPALLLAAAAAGCGGCGAPSETTSPPPATPPRAEVRFQDVTAEAGISFRHVSGAYGRKYLPETMGAGVAVLDYDGDGRQDLYFVNGARWPDAPAEARGPAPLPALYRNEGGGRFSDRTAEAGLDRSVYGMGATAADYDNDGDTDLFVTALGPDLLFRNDGGRFTEVGRQAGVDDPGFGSSAAFLDHDHDGDLDLFVCNYVEWTMANDIFCSLDGQAKSYCTPESYKGQSNRLFRNEGGGRFSDVSRQAGVHNPGGKSLGVTTLDYDDDGWVDIAVANDTQPNYLYRNNRDGTFTDLGREAGVAFSESGTARGAMGIDSADYDGTGRDSLVIGNFSNEMVGLYHNEGSGLFIDDAARAGVGLPSLLTLAFGCFFFDYDLDGRLDIFVANGHVEDDINRVQKDIHYAQRPHLFRNRGDGSFEPAVPAQPRPGDALQRAVVARGAAYLDHDEDGDLDVVMTTNNGPAYLLRNDGGSESSWLRVRLVGSRSNRDGVGARIRVTAGGRTMAWLVKTGASYCSQSELIATFGLGSEPAAARVEVAWPSGTRQALEGVAARSLLVVREDAVAGSAQAGGGP
ncbi:MAG TPA: CRTAC1 family protein [Candidatus Polarisedimenticolia bacterium]|nr:CRTAC1 family protein [Candidatus Polarisedimenticolia bacterium]